MSKELVISANRHEIKVAILEDDQLVEVFFQRANEYSLAGSIHKGRVTRVLPGMQSAFVDLGLERDTFLYVSDFFDETEEDFDRVSVNREAVAPRARGPRRSGAAIERPRQSLRPRSETRRRRSARRALRSRRNRQPPSAPQAERTDRGERPIGVATGADRGRRSRRRRGPRPWIPGFQIRLLRRFASAALRRSGARGRAELAFHWPGSGGRNRSECSRAPAQPIFPFSPASLSPSTRRSNIQPLDEAEEDEIRDLQETTRRSRVREPGRDRRGSRRGTRRCAAWPPESVEESETAVVRAGVGVEVGAEIEELPKREPGEELTKPPSSKARANHSDESEAEPSESGSAPPAEESPPSKAPRRRSRRRSASKVADSRIACRAACGARCAEEARASAGWRSQTGEPRPGEERRRRGHRG